MRCPKCSNLETKVVDSRVVEEWNSIRRRRECEYCNNRFTTFERISITDIVVIKKDGTSEIYDRMKLKRALMLAFAKRNISAEKIDEIVTTLETKWSGLWKEIKTTTIWDDVLEMIKDIDEVAYIRFASVYKNFNNLDDFKWVLK